MNPMEKAATPAADPPSRAAERRRILSLVHQGNLTEDQRIEVLNRVRTGVLRFLDAMGLEETPVQVAQRFAALAGSPRRVLELGASAGLLSWAIHRAAPEGAKPEIVCIEPHKARVRIGRSVLPEARWVAADPCVLAPALGAFDLVVANPPMGVLHNRKGPSNEVYRLIELARTYAPMGLFLIPAVLSANPPSRRGLGNGSTSCYEAFTRRTQLDIDMIDQPAEDIAIVACRYAAASSQQVAA